MIFTCKVILRSTAISSLFAIGMVAATDALAQEAPSAVPSVAAPSADPTMADIIVTARRRGENLQRVPVSVAVISGDQLAQRSITTERDLQSAVPGLVVRSTETSNNLSFSIRGQGVDAESGSRPGVLPYINEVQISTATTSSFFDLESVQVLKGPQGTLFGRNATGGAVLYSTAKPTEDFSGFMTVKGGNYGLKEFQGAVSIPLGDKVGLRIAGDLAHRDGFVTNIYNGDKLGAATTQAIRATLDIKPGDKFKNSLVFQYERDTGTNLSPQLYSAYACGSTNKGIPLATTTNCLFSPALDVLLGAPGAWNAYLAAHPKAPPGGMVAYVAQQKAMGLYSVNVDNPSNHRAHNFYLTNTSSYDLTPGIEIKNILGFAKATAKDNTDLDGSPYGLIEVRDASGAPSMSIKKTLQFSDELQFSGKAFNDHLTYVVGGYYGYQRDRSSLPTNVLDLAPIITRTNNGVAATLVNITKAVFAQGTYDVSDITHIEGLSITAGARYTWELNRITPNSPSIFFGGPVERQSTSKPSYQFGLEYQANSALLLYATTRGSFRSGGFNLVSPSVQATAEHGGNEFLPETTHDVEIGAKFQGRVVGFPTRLNVAVYKQWVSNVQRAAYVDINGAIGSVTVNVPKASIKGVEVDAEASPTTWLVLGGNMAYTDAQYTNGSVNLFGSLIDFGPYGDAPKWSGSVFAQVTVPVPDGFGRPVVRADVYAQSKQYFSNLAQTLAPDTSLHGYGLLNLRLDWHDISPAAFTASIFVKNATGRKFYAGGIPLGPGLGVNGVIPGEPRMYGAELSYKF
ncbi:MAG: TonB-dependent receptor [Sphingomonadales bacterium]|nr:TonB-dependent receptor [Sphingomonadales bacterium]